jgi:transposase
MYYIGIDVSTKESALCILDGEGKIVRETKLPTDPEIIARFIAATGLAIDRIGLESGCTAAWLFAGLQRYGWTVICIDARHAAAALRAGFRNKNDRNDARGIADLMRVNKYRPVWVKSPEAQRQGRLLTARAALQSQLVALENTIRGILRQEGIGLTDRRTAFEAAVREAIGEDRLLEAAVHPLLETRNAVLQHRATLDRQILRIVRLDPVCRLLMTAPGVGALVSLTFKVAVDDPRRFSRSRDVGAHFGLTPRECRESTARAR